MQCCHVFRMLRPFRANFPFLRMKALSRLLRYLSPIDSRAFSVRRGGRLFTCSHRRHHVPGRQTRPCPPSSNQPCTIPCISKQTFRGCSTMEDTNNITGTLRLERPGPTRSSMRRHVAAIKHASPE